MEVATQRLHYQQVKILGSISAMFAHGSVSLELFFGGLDISEALGVISYGR